jgi:hypothetical protein
MTTTTTATNGKTTTATRMCRWAVSLADARRMITSGMGAPCVVTEKGAESSYRIVPLGRSLWRVEKESADGSEPVAYTVDANKGADRWDWACDHNAVNGFSRKVACGCKHACLVAALLRKIGLVA